MSNSGIVSKALPSIVSVVAAAAAVERVDEEAATRERCAAAVANSFLLASRVPKARGACARCALSVTTEVDLVANSVAAG